MQIIPPNGSGAMKQSVIELLSPISAPRFSKYSGIQVCYPHRVHSYCYALSTAKSVALTHAPTTAQEWKNCVCLFVNIGDKYGKCYDNNFLNDGIEMTWFGQSAHSFDKPIMQRIMKIRSPADADSIHLFCRYEGEAYIYCGSAVPCCPCTRSVRLSAQLAAGAPASSATAHRARVAAHVQRGVCAPPAAEVPDGARRRADAAALRELS